MLLGLLFIVLTNIFAVLSPFLINNGVNVLRESKANFIDPMNQQLADNPEFDKDSLFEGVTIHIPGVVEKLSNWTGLSINEVSGIESYSDFLAAMVQVALILAVLYVIVYLIKGVFLFLTRQTIIVVSRYVEYDLKNEIYNHYQQLDTAFYKRNRTGDLMNRISEDVSNVRMYMGPAVMYTLNLIVLVILVISAMVFIDIELTLWALTPLPLMSVGIYIVSRRINKKSEIKQKQQSKLSSMVQESISGIRVLKAYNRERAQRDSFKEQSDLYKFKTLSLIKTEAMFMPIIVLLVGLSTILTIYIGGRKVISGEMEIEQIFQFIFYVNMLTWPFASVGWVTSLVQRAEASQARVNEFLKTEPVITNPSNRPLTVKGDIEFREVSFRYPDSGILALDKVSFRIRPGETLAVIGKTGSGKSTIADLICRLYDATEGEVVIDGKPINEVNLSDLRTAIGYVPQDVFLFSDTISNNIAFGVDDAGVELIERAAADANIHDDITHFDKGYETLLGERGINISGGQKQRISIARALAKNPDILIFDDCLSAVDTETEEHILGALKRIMKNKSSLVISHRISSIKHADRIIVLDNGRVVEQGVHDELIQKDGVYADMYRRQLLEEQNAPLDEKD
ncbi:MAG: ABC transporter ATP-binding protein [Flavobacteriales bacterium]|nr:ABC transporter ATP-binding protein [Flavobacteriales bacterium]